MSEGLLWKEEFRNDFDDEGHLSSLGGIYLTDDAEVAAFYAAKAITSEASGGMDPCLLVIEIPQEVLAADEDKLWPAVQTVFAKYGYYPEDDDAEVLEAAYDALLVDNSALLKELADSLAINRYAPELYAQDWEDLVREGVKGLLLLKYSFDWGVEYPECRNCITSINHLSTAASETINRSWLAQHYSHFAVTCRTLDPISADPTIDGPRIVGSICLRMSDDGLTVKEIETTGDVTPDHVDEFVLDFANKTWEITGCTISGPENGCVGLKMG